MKPFIRNVLPNGAYVDVTVFSVVKRISAPIFFQQIPSSAQTSTQQHQRSHEYYFDELSSENAHRKILSGSFTQTTKTEG